MSNLDIGRRNLVGGLLGSWLGATAAAAQEPSLGSLAAAREVVFGMAVTREQVQEAPALAAIALSQSRIIVPGTELKWSSVQPERDAFAFTDADAMVDFARDHSLLARGHALVWHEALPAWVDASLGDGMLTVMSHHIQTICSRYAGRMHSWDVVNEPLEPYDRQPGGLRASPFLKTMGPGYIELAFRLAAAADPHALLTLNEYGLEMDSALQARRRNAMLELLNRLVQRNVPVHALGIQGHLAPGKDAFDPDIFRGFIRAVASLGLQVFITELDTVDQMLPADIATRDAAAAAATRDYLNAALAEPSVRLVVTWGVSDRYSWVDSNPLFRRKDGLPSRPHLYDVDFKPKPLRQAVADALLAAPSRPAAA